VLKGYPPRRPRSDCTPKDEQEVPPNYRTRRVSPWRGSVTAVVGVTTVTAVTAVTPPKERVLMLAVEASASRHS
jgi:hypothetical protein